MKNRMDRRTFIKRGVFAVAGIGLQSALASGSSASLFGTGRERQTIAFVRDEKVVLSSVKFDPSLIDDMLGRAACMLSGEKNSRDGWARLIQPAKSDVIGLKVNNLGGRACRTAPELTYAVARSLQAIGVAKNRIIIWDWSTEELADRGYAICRTGGTCAASAPNPTAATMSGRWRWGIQPSASAVS